MALGQPWRLVEDHPRAVAEVRRWTDAACAELGAEDLSESIRLGVSELVTNAVLHGAAPARVRLRGTPEHPRVEVSDGSTVPPRFPGPPDPEVSTALPTVGNGLVVVGGLASAWGTDVRREGKVVWFTPTRPEEDTGPEDQAALPEPLIQWDADPPPVPPHPAAHHVRLRNLPADELLAFRAHYLELRRELWLITVTHRHRYPTATELTALFTRFDRTGAGPHQVGESLLPGTTLPELTLAAPPETPEVAGRMVELLDVADDFCRHHRLLALARDDEQVRFQGWYLHELVRQARGAEPLPWSEVA